MNAHHVYFDIDVEEFKVTPEKVCIGKTSDFSHYFTDPKIANEVMNLLNRQRHHNLYRCKDCGKYFWMTGAEKHWYEVRDMKAPVRCHVCRKLNGVLNKEVLK